MPTCVLLASKLRHGPHFTRLWSSVSAHWNRYFDLLDKRVPGPSDIPNYLEAVGCESMVRLANSYAEKEKWSSADAYMQRA